MLLDTTTRSIEILLGGSVTTRQLNITSEWVDMTTTVTTGGGTPINTNNTSAVTAIAAPAASTQRRVLGIQVYNADTVTQTVIVRYNDSATLYPIVETTVPAGYTLQYTVQSGWSLLSVTGSLQAGVTGPTGPTGAAGTAISYAATSGTNTYTATMSPAPVAYTSGDSYVLKFGNANSTAVTINLNSLGAKTLQLNGAAMTGGELPANSTRIITYDGTNFQLDSGVGGSGSSGISNGQDKNRPTPTSNTIYLATDSKLAYVSDGSKWFTSTGQDKIALGPFTDSNYMRSGFSGTNVGPTMTNPYTVVIGWNTLVTPGTTQQILMAYFGSGAGWYLGGSSANANKLSALLGGVNGGAENEFSGMNALTTGPHSAAMSYDGSNLVLVVDGGSAQTIATTGTLTAANGQFFVGRYSAANGFACANSTISYVYGYASALSTGDKQTLTATPSDYNPGLITANPAYVWMAKSPWLGSQQRVWGSGVNADGTSSMSGLGTLAIVEY